MNLDEVARRAGVSVATASRVLNQSAVVKESTKLRVLKAAEDLKYYPNVHARALAVGTSRTLGLIVSNLENPFFLDIFRALEKEAHDHGYEVLVANTDYDAQRLKTSVRTMLGRRVAGLGLVISEIDPVLLDELQDRKIRTVVYDVGNARHKMLSIKANYAKGMQRVIEYLRSLGHSKMAFVGHHTWLGPLSHRKEAFVKAMERYAPTVQYRTVADADAYSGGRSAVREIFSGDFHPTAIVCANDFMAIGVLRQLREIGLDVPRHVSVSGFDNISLSEVVYPSLTTLHIPRDLIGRQIFESLTAPGPAVRAPEVVIEPELMVRESTGPVAQSLTLPIVM